jgi:hypothetical protein
LMCFEFGVLFSFNLCCSFNFKFFLLVCGCNCLACLQCVLLFVVFFFSIVFVYLQLRLFN